VKFGRVAKIGEKICRPLLNGPWEGDDARNILTEAIEWWKRQLDAIDREAAQLSPAGSVWGAN
jgi:hypothetical protein